MTLHDARASEAMMKDGEKGASLARADLRSRQAT